MPNLTPQKIKEKLDAIAEDLARQTFQGMLAEITRVTDKVGNSINANGQPLSQELFLQMLEGLFLSFDENGNWIPPTILLSPDMQENFMEKMKSWENDPMFLAERAEIVARKKEEWLDRENRRKLVD